MPFMDMRIYISDQNGSYLYFFSNISYGLRSALFFVFTQIIIAKIIARIFAIKSDWKQKNPTLTITPTLNHNTPY